MRHCAFTLCGTEVELSMARDPANHEWLAITRWHPEEFPQPLTYIMPPQAAGTDEEIAWEAAKDWASRNLSRDWIAVVSTEQDLQRLAAAHSQMLH